MDNTQTQSLDFEWCSMEPGVGLSDLCGSLPTRDILFYNSVLAGPFQVRILYDSVILIIYVCGREWAAIPLF